MNPHGRARLKGPILPRIQREVLGRLAPISGLNVSRSHVI
jgi:hypothetical protein